MTFATNAKQRKVGLDDARPLPRLGLVGREYYATDTQITYVCISSTTWGVLVGGAVEADLACHGTLAARAASQGWAAPTTNTVTAAPQFVDGYTMVVGYYPIAAPTAPETLVDGREQGVANNGFWLVLGYNAGDRCIPTMYLHPGGVVNGVQMASATFAGALNTLHVLSMTVPSAGGSPFSLRWSFDGGAVGSGAYGAGVLAPRVAGANDLAIGCAVDGSSPFLSGRDAFVQSYLGVATDAQLVALSNAAVRASGRPAIVPAGGGLTCKFAWRAAWVPHGAVEAVDAIARERLYRGRGSMLIGTLVKFAI